MTGYHSLARNRDFTTLWIGETVSELGSRMSMFVFPLLAYALSGSALLAALAEAAYLVGLVGALLPAGVLADRWNRRTVMLWSSSAGLVLYSSMVVAGILDAFTITHLVVVGVLTGIAAGVFGPAQMSAIRSVVTTEELPTALSQNQARQHVASLLGAPLGGLLYGLVRWLPFLADAISFGISCVTLSRIKTDLSPVATAGPRRRIRADIAEGVRFVLSRPLFRTLALWAALSNLVNNAVLFVVFLRLIQEDFHPAEIGLVEAAAGVAGIVGAILAPWIIDRFRTGRLTVLIAWSNVIPLIPLVFWAHPVVAAATLATILLLNPAGNAGIGSYRISVTPAELQGRVQSASQFLSMSVMPLAPVLGGILLEGFGGTVAVASLVIACAGVALVVTLSAAVRSVPRPAEWAAPASAASGISISVGARP